MNDGLTKKNLAKQFNITGNTVTKTLKASGLDTSKETYTEEEVERFAVARKLLDTGNYNYKDIEQHFDVRSANSNGNGNEHTSPENYDTSGSGTSVTELIATEIAGSVQEIVRASVAEMVPYIPKMAASALEEAARNGDIRAAFEKYRHEYVESQSTNTTFAFGTITPISEISEDIVGASEPIDTSPEDTFTENGSVFDSSDS